MSEEIWMIDFEGTLTDNAWRQHLVASAATKENWKEYFAGLEKDKPNLRVMELAFTLRDAGRTVILYTTRMPNYHELETKWLTKHGMLGFELLQRVNTKLPADKLLREWVEEIKPTHLIDDRDSNRGAIADLVPNVYSPDDLTEEVDYEQERKDALCD